MNIPGNRIKGLLAIVLKLLAHDWCTETRGNTPLLDWPVCCGTIVGVPGIKAAPLASNKWKIWWR